MIACRVDSGELLLPHGKRAQGVGWINHVVGGITAGDDTRSEQKK